MTHRFVILLAAVVLCVAALAGVAARTRPSDATFTTSSQSAVTASVDSITNWLHIYSQNSPDPDGLGGYAHQQNVPSQPLISTGTDKGLVVDLGKYPDLNKTFAFTRVLTLKAPGVFPVAGVTQVTVTVTLVADAGGTQPLRNPYLHLTTQTVYSSSVTLRANDKAQLDISLRTKKNPWDAGNQFRPHIVLSLTYPGGPAGAYAYDLTALLSII